jgi:CheY-like chemotaxis protein
MKKVLVIDDDKDVLDVMQEALEYGGYTVQTTDTSDNVFGLIASFDPQLVLIDFMLHGANGGEICHQIKTDKRTEQIPVVIVSAYSRVILSLGNYSCDGMISKPFDLDDLLSTVKSYMPRERVGS